MNAKEEFVEHVEDRVVYCATVSVGYSEQEEMTSLKVKYSSEDYLSFLSKLDFEYDAGYGGRQLYGTIWYTDGTWSSRVKYDGTSLCSHHSLPEIPECLL